MKEVENIIKEAIENQKVIHFDYNGYSRRVEPHHYGLLNQFKQLHGYQIGNGSKSGKVPQWRNFRLERIRNISIDHATAFARRNDHNPLNSHYSKILKSVETNKRSKRHRPI